MTKQIKGKILGKLKYNRFFFQKKEVYSHLAKGSDSLEHGSFSGFCLSLGYRIPCGLFTSGSFYPVVLANGLVLKDLAKWRDFHFSRIFRRLLT